MSEEVVEQHYCQEHNVPFKKFEKNNKSWYSHKNGDGWCNEVKKNSKPKEEVVFSVPQVQREYPNTDRQDSIERQVALKIVAELYAAGKLDADTKRVKIMFDWIDSHIGNAPELKTTVPKMTQPIVTKEEVKQALNKITHSVDYIVKLITTADINGMKGWTKREVLVKLQAVGAKGNSVTEMLNSLPKDKYDGFCNDLMKIEKDLVEPVSDDNIPF